MTDRQHAAREHATWSASATERLWACAGSLALTDGLPETTSEAADWGTCAHQVAEKCLRGNGPAERYIGTTEKGKSHSFEVDEEMAETAQTYVDYVLSVIDQEGEGVQFWIEQHFTLNSLKPPFDAGGTADAVVYLPKARVLEVIDLKGGRGHVVEAKGNPQGRTYALGAMLAHQGLNVERVKVTIVQPRAPHKDGRIRSDEFHVADLVEWTTDLVAAMKRAHQALVALPGGSPREVSSIDVDTGEDLVHYENMPPAEWASSWLKAGDHCKFCKAKPTCPAIERAVQDQVGLWFDDTDAPRLANIPNPTEPAQIAAQLDALDLIEGWCNAVREHAHRQAESGVEIPGYVLVPKQGREKWKDDKAVLELLRGSKVAEKLYLNPGKLRTPKQVRKDLGTQALLVHDMSETPDAGTNLVRADKTTRAPVQGTAARFFEPTT